MLQVQNDLAAVQPHIARTIMQHHSVVADAHLLFADKLARLPPFMHAAACHHAAMPAAMSADATAATDQMPVLMLEASKAEHCALFHSVCAALPELQGVMNIALRLHEPFLESAWCMRAAEQLVQASRDHGTASCAALEAGDEAAFAPMCAGGRRCKVPDIAPLERLLQLAAPTLQSLAVHTVDDAVSMLWRNASHLAGLRQLTLTRTNYGDRSKEAHVARFYYTVLQRCTALTALCLHGFVISHDDTHALASALLRMTGLRSLQLQHSPGTYTAVASYEAMSVLSEQLANVSSLATLDVVGFYSSDDGGASFMPIPALPSLRQLRCGVWTWKGAKGLDTFVAQLQQLTALTHLHILGDDLDSTWEDDRLAAVVGVVAGLTDLRLLQLCAKPQTYARTGPALCRALAALTHLSSLQVHGLDRDMMASLSQHLANLPALHCLHFVACSAAGCAVALQAFTGLRSFTCEGYEHDESSFALYAQSDMKACIIALAQHTQLTHVSLRQAAIDDRQVLTLACAAAKWQWLAQLDLSGNELGASQTSGWGSSCNLDFSHMRKLLAVLAQLASFRQLDVSCNRWFCSFDAIALVASYPRGAGRRWVLKFDKPQMVTCAREAVCEEVV